MQEAVQDWTHVIQLNNQHALTYCQLSLAHRFLENHQEAFTCAEMYLQLKPLTNRLDLAHFQRGMCAAELGKWQLGEEDLKAAINLDKEHNQGKNNRLYRCSLAHIQASAGCDATHKRDAFAELVKLYTEMKELASDDWNSYYIRAITLNEMDRHEEAIKDFQHFLTGNPEHIEARYRLGVCYQVLNQHTNAVDVFSHILERAPHHIRALWRRGISRERVGNNNDALADFDLGINSALNCAELYYERGQLHYKVGHSASSNGPLLNHVERHEKNQQATNDWKRTVELNPSFCYAYFRLAIVYEEEHKCEEAFDHFNNAIIAQNPTSLNDAIRIINDTETKLICNIQKSNTGSAVNNIQTEMREYYDQLEELIEYKSILMSIVEERQASKDYKAKLDQDTTGQLREFHDTLVKKLEALFCAFKTLSTGLVRINGSGKLNRTGDAFTLLGETFNLIPAVCEPAGQIVIWIGSLLRWLGEIRHMNIAREIANLGTIAELQAAVFNMARKITDMYEEQILQLSQGMIAARNTTNTVLLVPPHQSFCTRIGGRLKRTRRKLFKEENISKVQQVAEYGVLLLLEKLQQLQITSRNETWSLTDQFVNSICHVQNTTATLSAKEKIKKKMHIKQGWSLDGFYRKTGVRTDDGQEYGTDVVDIKTYGFRKGTEKEIQIFKLKPICDISIKSQNCIEGENK
jgi:tetratricopeptide (TPR) repeat protein